MIYCTNKTVKTELQIEQSKIFDLFTVNLKNEDVLIFGDTVSDILLLREINNFTDEKPLLITYIDGGSSEDTVFSKLSYVLDKDFIQNHAKDDFKNLRTLQGLFAKINKK